MLLVQRHLEDELKRRGCQYRFWKAMRPHVLGAELEFKTPTGREYLMYVMARPGRLIAFTLRNAACTRVLAGGVELSVDDVTIAKKLASYFDVV